jgi:Ribonuclease G/E
MMCAGAGGSRESNEGRSGNEDGMPKTDDVGGQSRKANAQHAQRIEAEYRQLTPIMEHGVDDRKQVTMASSSRLVSAYDKLAQRVEAERTETERRHHTTQFIPQRYRAGLARQA